MHPRRFGTAVFVTALAGALAAPASLGGGFLAQKALLRARPQGQPQAATDGAGPADPGKARLHIPRSRNISFTYNLTDGGGFRWDIQYYGTVGQGTNYAYSGGLYCQLNGTNIHSNGQGWINEAGDEIEIGPYNHSNLRIYRRVKVYKDAPLARWLDIFENPNSQDVTVQLQIYTNTNWSISSVTYPSGKGQFGEKDESFITETQSGSNPPALWHYVCDARSKIRPTISVQNNQIYVRYALTVPANKTIALCYFESQNHSVSDLKKLTRTFRAQKLLRDLSPAVRKLVVNIPGGLNISGVELERSDVGDVILNRNGDPIYGRVTNESFALETFFGRMPAPAAQTVGMAAAGGEDDRFQVVLVGGQVIAGRLDKGAKVDVDLPAGGKLQVPFSDIRQWSYRISPSRPEETELAGPLMILRTGDRVAFKPESTRLRLRTRHGTVDLAGKDLLRIALDNAANAVHRVTFLNGSKLAGFVEPAEVPVTLQLGPKLAVPRDLIAQMQFAEEDKPDPTLDAVVLSNGDELFGRLATEKFVLRTDYGTVSLRPENIRAIVFSPTHLGRAAIELWDGSILRGQCGQETLDFQITPGPLVHIYTGQFVQISRRQALPPREIIEKVEKLVGLLGAESFKDRQTATDELIRLGKGIVPLLRKYVTTSDPEVRQRVEDILERLEGRPTGPHPNPMPGAIRFGARR